MRVKGDKSLSVCIPARNEEFLARTIDDVFANAQADTEVIAVLDGYWPNPPIKDHPKLTIIHHDSIGQRSATNEAARVSQAKYVMKADAHCCFDKGFDVKLMANCEPDWTVVPWMYNMHVFNWVCKCGKVMYQGPEVPCPDCGSKMEREMIWKPRRGRKTSTWRFGSDMVFQYWHGAKDRPEIRPGIIETMSFIGACWFTERERYWELGGLDTGHGEWGQVGTEIACKTWLSGGKLVTNRNTWFGHMFRSQFGWPYPISQGQIDRAREYSRDLWLNNKWPKAKYPVSWLVERFAPVPGW